MGARILLVEDNEDNLQLMTYLLGAHGHEVSTASRGADAVMIARAERPDLIVMDIQLVGGMDGYQALEQIRASPGGAAVPVLAVTAYAMVGDRDRALAAGFTHYVTKPIDPQSFGASIDGCLPPPLRGAPLVRHHHPASHAAGSDPPPAANRDGDRILIVDDQPMNVALLRSILESRGYRVSQASSVEQAVRLARRDRPALVLSDVHLRNELGHEIYHQLRAVPELAGTAFALTTATMDLRQAGGPDLAAMEIIRRPIEPQELLARVAQIIRAAGT
jgi:two-component system, cell cycle response regulator